MVKSFPVDPAGLCLKEWQETSLQWNCKTPKEITACMAVLAEAMVVWSLQLLKHENSWDQHKKQLISIKLAENPKEEWCISEVLRQVFTVLQDALRNLLHTLFICHILFKTIIINLSSTYPKFSFEESNRTEKGLQATGLQYLLVYLQQGTFWAQLFIGKKS